MTISDLTPAAPIGSGRRQCRTPTPPWEKIVTKYRNFVFFLQKFSLKNFETIFLEAAKEFIASLDKKSASKVFYNIDLAEQTNDTKIFKKLQGKAVKIK